MTSGSESIANQEGIGPKTPQPIELRGFLPYYGQRHPVLRAEATPGLAVASASSGASMSASVYTLANGDQDGAPAVVAGQVLVFQSGTGRWHLN